METDFLDPISEAGADTTEPITLEELVRLAAAAPTANPASTAAVRVKWRSVSSSRRISKRLFSALSSRISRFGFTREIWRHSSEPIEPPAPVTSTTSPAR